MVLRITASSLLTIGLFAQPAHYLVLQKAASSLGWYTPDGKPVASVPVGQHPHEMVFSRDKKLLYTTDNGTMRIEHAGAGGNTVSIIDVGNRKRIAQISTGEFRRPHGIDLDEATGRLAVTTEMPDKLLIIDPDKRSIIRAYDTKGKTSHMVSFGPGAQFAYVSNSSSANIAAVRLSDGAVTLIPTGTRPEANILSNDGKQLFVCNREGASITVIDTAKNAVAGTIATGKGPVRGSVTPDGKMLVYALMHDKKIGIADIATRKEVATIDLGGTPVSLTLSPDGRTAHASDEEAGVVYIASIAERKVLRTLKTAKGAGPDPVLEAPAR